MFYAILILHIFFEKNERLLFPSKFRCSLVFGIGTFQIILMMMITTMNMKRLLQMHITANELTCFFFYKTLHVLSIFGIVTYLRSLREILFESVISYSVPEYLLLYMA